MLSDLAAELCTGASKNMASEPSSNPVPDSASRTTRVPLGKSGQRLSFEGRLRLWLYLLGLPMLIVCWLWMRQLSFESVGLIVAMLAVSALWAFAVSLLTELITRPLQTLSNVVAALREDDYSFRARGARKDDALGDLALEINALAGLLQGQRDGALEAIDLVERVMRAMQSPVVAFDPEGRLRSLNAAGERAFGISLQASLGHFAEELMLEKLLNVDDDEVITLGDGPQSVRWVVKRTSFRLRGVPHLLVVLSDVSVALREEERLAWERLIRVLGHEINNSLTPIKSIAGSLRAQLASRPQISEQTADFVRGLEVIENRSESLNRFLQAYRQLMGLPPPKLAPVSLVALVARVARLETRTVVAVNGVSDVILQIDADHIEQALINLVRNATEAAMSPDAAATLAPEVQISWEIASSELVIAIRDNGPGLTNEGNLFVPFYTTKPSGTGIGLVLAQQIAQAHRGSVQLSNRNDGHTGCKAELRLPLPEKHID